MNDDYDYDDYGEYCNDDTIRIYPPTLRQRIWRLKNDIRHWLLTRFSATYRSRHDDIPF